MNRRRMVVVATCLLLLLSGGLAVTLRSQNKPPVRAFGPDITQAVSDELIAGYRQWTRVNPEPNLVDGRVAQMCAPATSLLPPKPHDKYITVYVNDIGRHAMLDEKSPHFPQGSIIVKEKLTTVKSTTPELLTVMVKREPAFNPEGGNWEYVILDGEGREVKQRGKLENCESCHQLNKGNDYVSRSYLPADVVTRLK